MMKINHFKKKIVISALMAALMTGVSVAQDAPVMVDVTKEGQQAAAQQDAQQVSPYIPNPYRDETIQRKPEKQLDIDAREQWMGGNFPITPEDVNQYIKKSTSLERSFKPNLNVNLVKKSININPNESQNYPKIITSMGFNTVITFWDASGEPWNIEYVANGNDAQFIVNQPTGIKHKNIIIINPRELSSKTNLTISLTDEKNPITVEIVTNDLTKDINTAYGEVAINLRKRNPSTVVPDIQVDTSFSQSKEDSNVLISFMDGLPPKEAKPLIIKGGDDSIKAWVYKDEYYIKTTHSLVWPPTSSIQRDGSNSAVYKTAKSPLIRVTNLKTGSTKNYEVNFDGE